jgi:peroxiredoxin
MRYQVGDSAPDSTMLDVEGNTVHLSQYWQKSPMVLSFLRHFG